MTSLPVTNALTARETVARARRAIENSVNETQLLDLYQDLHQHPELAMHEVRTAAIVAGQLSELGATVTTGIGGTGVVGIVENGSGPTVMLRADMDALPITEQTGLGYFSREQAQISDGSFAGVMHACGHDVHIAAMLGAARALAGTRDAWSGRLMLVAQPAEETAEGAEAMLADGVFRRFGKPDIALGQHTESFGVGHVGHRSGLMASAALNVEIRVFGKGGHGSTPALCVDPIVVAAFLVTRLQTLVSREIDPAQVAVLTIGMISGGTAPNIIPDEVTLTLNLRFQTDAVKKILLDGIARIALAESQAAGCPRDPTIRTFGSFPATVNDVGATEFLRTVHEEAFGTENVHDIPVSLGSEDFSAFGVPGPAHYDGPAVPYVYWTFGVIEEQLWSNAVGSGFQEKLESMPSAHTSTFSPDGPGSLRTGVLALTSAAFSFLGHR